MAGRTNAAAAPTRYAGLQVMSAIQGLQIPIGWGTARVGSNVIWYGDFKSTATKSGGGKGGGGSASGYNYTASFVLGICAGPVAGIRTIYQNGSVYSSASAAKLNISLGAFGAAPWSYLSSRFPSQALGYSLLATAYQSNYPLGSSASVPSHGFEVQFPVRFSGSDDAAPAALLTDFFQNANNGIQGWVSGLLGNWTQYNNYTVAAGLLLSPLIDQKRTGLDFLAEIMTATNSSCTWSEGVLKIIPYGDVTLTGNGVTYVPNLTPVYSLNDDSWFPSHDGEDPIDMDVMDQSDAFNIVQIEFLGRSNNYNSAIATAQDTSNISQFGKRQQDPTSLHCICDGAVAQHAAQLLLQRTLYIRGEYRFNLPWNYALLEPGDIVTLTDAGCGLASYPVRITQIEEDEERKLSFTAEDLLAGVSHTPLFNHQDFAGTLVTTIQDPGGVEANLLLWSENPTNAAYVKSSVTVTGGAANDQNGAATAAAVSATAVAGGHQLIQSSTQVFPGVPYTYSVCLQQGTHSLAQVVLTDASASGVTVSVDLNAGVITVPAASFGTNAVLIGATIIPTLTMGIWQVTITGTFATLPVGYLSAGVSVLSAAGAYSWTGDATNAFYVSQQALRQGVLPGAYARTTTTVSGPLLFNPPSTLTQAGQETWIAAAGGPNWGGANVWVSLDGGATYGLQGAITSGSARFGALSASVVSGADPDTTDTFSVDLSASGGVLTTAASSVADANGTMCLVDNEIISFSTATLTRPNGYNLTTYTRRGAQGTTRAAHAAGARFVRLDNSIFVMPFLAVQQGHTAYVKFQSYNIHGGAVQSLSNCVAYTFTPGTVLAGGPFGSNVNGVDIGATFGADWLASLANLPGNLAALAPTDAIKNSILSGALVAGTVVPATFAGRGALATKNTANIDTDVTDGTSYLRYPSADFTKLGGVAPLATVGGTWGVNIGSRPSNLAGLGGAEILDNSVLSGALVAGTVVPATFSGRGALASKSSVDLSTGDVANKKTSNLADDAGLGNTALWTGVTGAAKPADNATVGAIWGTNLTGRPANIAGLGGSEVLDNSVLSGALVAGTVVPATFSGRGALATRSSVKTGDGSLTDAGGNTLADTSILNSYTENAQGYVMRPVGGSFAPNSPVTGALKIRSPQKTSGGFHTMLRFFVDVFEYNTDASATYEVGGYIYPETPAWYNTYARVVGPAATTRPVYHGRDAAGYWCIWIGDKATVWQYPVVTMRNLQLGYANYLPSDWGSGWVISLDTTDRTATDNTVAHPVPGDMTFGINARESVGGPIALLADFKTSLGTLDLSLADGAAGGIKNKSLANVDGTANTKLTGIAAGATVGGTWGTNVFSIPTNLTLLSGGEVIDNSVLSGALVAGTVVPATFAGRGALASKGSVDLSTADVTNKKTSYLADDAGLGNTALWTGVTGATKPADNATVGAAWGTNLTGRPANIAGLGGAEIINNAAVSANNLIQNPGAELGTITGWFVGSGMSGAGAGAALSLDAYNYTSGAQSFAITKAATTDGGTVGHIAVPVKPGQAYYIGAALLGSTAVGGVYIQLRMAPAYPTNGIITDAIISGAGTSHTLAAANNIAASTVWARYYEPYVIPAGMYWASLCILNFVNGPLQLDFDDAVIAPQTSFSQGISGVPANVAALTGPEAIQNSILAGTLSGATGYTNVGGVGVNTAQGLAYSQSPQYPASSTSTTTITMASSVITTPLTAYSLPSATLSSLAVGTIYAVFYDLVAASYVAVASGSTAAYYASPSRYLYAATQSTQVAGGGYTAPPSPPSGGGRGVLP